MQRLYAPRQLFSGEGSLSYAQAEDRPTDAEGRRQIGITACSEGGIAGDASLSTTRGAGSQAYRSLLATIAFLIYNQFLFIYVLIVILHLKPGK